MGDIEPGETRNETILLSGGDKGSMATLVFQLENLFVGETSSTLDQYYYCYYRLQIALPSCQDGCEPVCQGTPEWRNLKRSQRGCVIEPFGDQIIIAGVINLGDIQNIEAWDGENFSSLGTGINGRVFDLEVHNGLLYAGGTFSSAGDIETTNLAYWDGIVWHGCGDGAGGGDSSIVSALLSTPQGLVVGGRFTNAGPNIALWSGQEWVPDYFTEGPDGLVNALALFNGQIIAGGDFQSPGKNITAWSNGLWSTLSHGILQRGLSERGTRSMLVVNDSSLVVGGSFDGALDDQLDLIPGTRDLAEWNGENWNSIGGGTQEGEEGIFDLALCGESIYIAGDFVINDGSLITGIAKWEGDQKKWGGINRDQTAVLALACTSGSLANGECQILAGWEDGVDVLDCITQTNHLHQGDFVIYPNPTTGDFTIEFPTPPSPGTMIRLFDATGQLQQWHLISENSFTQTIHGQELSEGVYLVQVISINAAIGVNKIVVLKN
jgi:hypothetical protein